MHSRRKFMIEASHNLLKCNYTGVRDVSEIADIKVISYTYKCPKVTP